MKIVLLATFFLGSVAYADLYTERAQLAAQNHKELQQRQARASSARMDRLFLQNLRRFGARHGGIKSVLSCQDRTDLNEPGNQGSIGTRQVCDGDFCVPVTGLRSYGERGDGFHEAIFSCRVHFNDDQVCEGSFWGRNWEKFGGACFSGDGKGTVSTVGTGRRK